MHCNDLETFAFEQLLSEKTFLEILIYKFIESKTISVPLLKMGGFLLSKRWKHEKTLTQT